MDPFTARLCIAPQFSLAQLPHGPWVLWGESQSFRLRSPRHVRVLRALDEARACTGHELMHVLEGELGGAEVLFALTQLHSQGVLREDQGGEQDGPPARIEHALAGVEASSGASPRVRVSVETTNSGTSTNGFANALSQAGATVEPEATLAVLTTGHYLEPSFRERLGQRWTRGQTTLPVKLTAGSVWVGPLLDPRSDRDGAPCPECVAAVVARNQPIARLVLAEGASGPVRLPGTQVDATTLQPAAQEVVRSLDPVAAGPASKDLATHLRALDLERSQTASHRVVRRPQCPLCGDAEWLQRQLEAPVTLDRKPHAFTEDGGYRSVSPQQTYDDHAHLVNPVTGVIAGIGPLTERDHPLRPVWAASYFVCPQGGAPGADEEFSRTSMGKGRTPAQARASALCEGIERWACTLQGDEPRVRASRAELGEAAVDPTLLQNFSETQYRSRDDAGADRRLQVPMPFRDDLVIDWTPAWSLRDRTRRYLPTRYSFTQFQVPPDERICDHNPNGHAAGNCVEEAILQGFLELVERDATAIWWYNRLSRPAFELASFDDLYFREVERHYEELGYRVRVLDLTHDLEIPVAVALADDPRSGRYTLGFGCHLDVRLAVQRALTEMHQVFDPTGTRETPFTAADFEDSSFLFASGEPRRADDYPDQRSADLCDDVDHCVRAAAAAGLEVIVQNYTRPDVGLSTVKVVAPGMRHFWPRFGPGRLYDVPCQLGWLDAPIPEASLNPVALLL